MVESAPSVSEPIKSNPEKAPIEAPIEPLVETPVETTIGENIEKSPLSRDDPISAINEQSKPNDQTPVEPVGKKDALPKETIGDGEALMKAVGVPDLNINRKRDLETTAAYGMAMILVSKLEEQTKTLHEIQMQLSTLDSRMDCLEVHYISYWTYGRAPNAFTTHHLRMHNTFADVPMPPFHVDLSTNVATVVAHHSGKTTDN
ncbi:hypothetical protein L6452_37172 [Arctium lappa]|uniref:Uncharacterized protein n=1 Tax=Arctium lappa TaxID=4217 RepID=A0ACB8Y1J2_ARCLA|nr:hypothetical protein L6452_37172 [Arctium lappa]